MGQSPMVTPTDRRVDDSAVGEVRSKPSARSIALLAIKIVVSFGLIFYLLKKVDIAQVQSLLVAVRFEYLLLAGVLIIIQYLFVSLRWKWVVSKLGGSLQFRDAVRLTFEGCFFNQLLPSSIGGDAVRILRARNLLGSVRLSGASVLLDRFLGLLALTLLVLAIAPFFFGLVSNDVIRLLLGAALAGGLFGTLSFFALSLFGAWISSWPVLADAVGLSQKCIEIVKRREFPIIFFVSMLAHCTNGFVFWILAIGMGVGLSLWSSLVLVPPAMLVTLVPVSIAGWGLRENAIVVLLAYVAVPSEQALALSVLYGLLSVVVSLPGGVLWLRNTKARHRPQKV